MGHSDKLLSAVGKRNDDLLVLKPDHARRPKARHADTRQFVEEDAAVRVASSFRHGYLRLRIDAVSSYHTAPQGAAVTVAGSRRRQPAAKEPTLDRIRPLALRLVG
jgi:hypothetical protein